MTTKLLFIHGAPATGKLTVARAILQRVPGRLFDNHAAIDTARTVFDFDTPGFWELVQSTRISVLEHAALFNVPLVAMTFCYSDPEDKALFQSYEAIATKHNAKILPVFLSCSDDEKFRRVGNPDRIKRNKIASTTSLTTYLANNNFVPVPHADCIQLDTDTACADTTAQKITDHFQLA